MTDINDITIQAAESDSPLPDDDDFKHLKSVYEQVMAGKAWRSVFSDAVEAIDWQNKSPAFYREVIGMTITLEMAKLAYRLAKQGDEQYPENTYLQNAEYVLAPPVVRMVDTPPVPGLPDTMKWFEQHYNEYRGQWVAVLDGKFIAASPSHDDLMAKIKNVTGTPGLIVTRVLE